MRTGADARQYVTDLAFVCIVMGPKKSMRYSGGGTRDLTALRLQTAKTRDALSMPEDSCCAVVLVLR